MRLHQLHRIVEGPVKDELVARARRVLERSLAPAQVELWEANAPKMGVDPLVSILWVAQVFHACWTKNNDEWHFGFSEAVNELLADVAALDAELDEIEAPPVSVPTEKQQKQGKRERTEVGAVKVGDLGDSAVKSLLEELEEGCQMTLPDLVGGQEVRESLAVTLQQERMVEEARDAEELRNIECEIAERTYFIKAINHKLAPLNREAVDKTVEDKQNRIRELAPRLYEEFDLLVPPDELERLLSDENCSLPLSEYEATRKFRVKRKTTGPVGVEAELPAKLGVTRKKCEFLPAMSSESRVVTPMKVMASPYKPAYDEESSSVDMDGFELCI